jgi:hypothetical protein
MVVGMGIEPSIAPAGMRCRTCWADTNMASAKDRSASAFTAATGTACLTPAQGLCCSSDRRNQSLSRIRADLWVSRPAESYR